MKLAIVDDEKGIIEGLKTIVRRYLPDCAVVATAYNGVDGCRVIQEAKPDIVITDIRMPQADGLEMIRKLTAAGCRSKFIILSGYADFEYARQGMELGVRFYINKPVEEQELRECVNKVASEIAAERTEARRWNELVLRDVLENGYQPAFHESQLSDSNLDLPVSDHHYACIVVDAEHVRDRFEERWTRISDKMRRDLTYYRQLHMLRYDGSKYVVLAVHHQKIDAAALVEDMKQLQAWLNQECGGAVTIGIGNAYSSPAGIRESFGEARQALHYRLTNGANAVFSYPDQGPLSDKESMITEEQLAKLDRCVSEMDADGAASEIRSIFRAFGAKSGLTFPELRDQVLLILISSLRQLSVTQLQAYGVLSDEVLSQDEISRFKTMEELELRVIGAVDRVIERKRGLTASKKKDVITEIKEYVTAHYDNNITLADLSARFYMNQYYLSQLFKEKTGVTYLSFVTGVRMSKAKELLDETDLKVYEICRRVGYVDTAHFSKLFEKVTGFTPSDYRKRKNI